MNDRVSTGVENRFEQSGQSLSAAQLFLEQQRFNRPQYAVPDTSFSALPNIEIVSHNQYSPTDTPQVRLAKDAQNAKEQLKDLLKKSGATANDRDGLGMEELNALEQRTDLTEAQRRAVRYMKDNFDALATRRLFEDVGGATNWGPIGSPLQRRRITPDALDRNQHKADKPTDPVQQEFKGNGPRNIPQEPFEPRVRTQPEPAERPSPNERGRDVPLRKTGLNDELSRDDVVVKEGWGWETIARESLRKQGRTSQNGADVYKEIERLQRLNPDKVRMVHPNDRIKTR